MPLIKNIASSSVIQMGTFRADTGRDVTCDALGAAGARIGELIMQLLSGKKPEDIHEIWPVELVLRESTGPAQLRLATTG